MKDDTGALQNSSPRKKNSQDTHFFSCFPKGHPEWSDNQGHPFGKCREV